MCVFECVGGGCYCPELPPQRRGSRQEILTQKNHKHHISAVSSVAKNTAVRLRLISPPLRPQGAMQTQAPPFFFLVRFDFFPHPSLKLFRPIVLTTSSPSLVDYMTEPRFPLVVPSLSRVGGEMIKAIYK